MLVTSIKLTSRKAFTMLEMIFVIVIMGIVASIGSTIIAQLFENYIIQRASHKVAIKTELAINQIVNRLTYRINDSVVARNPTTNARTPLNAMMPGVTNRADIVLEWIGYDNDSFSTTIAPLWSGYCDTVVTGVNTIVSPGSTFNNLMATVNNLSPVANPQLGLFFSLAPAERFQDNPALTHESACYYHTDTPANPNCVHGIINIVNNTTLTTNNMPAGENTHIASHYKLAWSAYALVPVDRAGVQIAQNSPTVDFDLELRYGYQPWTGGTYQGAQSSIIARNVTSFKFLEQAGTLRIKLCMTEQTGGTNNISVCKEKVVMR